MDIRLFCLCLALTFTLSADSIASIGVGLFRWHKKDVTVCWLDSDTLPADAFSPLQLFTLEPYKKALSIADTTTKQTLQEKVNAEFTKERTGIHFVGWKSCADEKNADVILLTADSRIQPGIPQGYASVGRSEKGQDWDQTITERAPEFKAYLYIDMAPIKTSENPALQGLKITYEQRLFGTFLHELGHVAGLLHEHAHPQAPGEGMCHSRKVFPPELKHTEYYSAYDPNSIMNECFLNVLDRTGLKFQVERVPYERDSFKDKTLIKNSSMFGRTFIEVRIGLSKADVHGLRCLYVFSMDEQVRCHVDFVP